jgi:hypothetical protein
MPLIIISPSSGCNAVESIRKVVVLPAPLGPSKANTLPLLQEKLTFFTE